MFATVSNLRPSSLPLTADFEEDAVRRNSLAITEFVRSALSEARHRFGWPRYLIDQSSNNDETIVVLSEAFMSEFVTKYPWAPETLLSCLNFTYSDQLTILSECEKLLATK